MSTRKSITSKPTNKDAVPALIGSRVAHINRVTKESSIDLSLSLDGGNISISTGIGFLDHMLDLFAHHGRFGLLLNAEGDIYVDYHHTVEDIGIVLGQAFYAAAGDKIGINRYGGITLPMDETLVEVALDFGGRPFFAYNCDFQTEKVGTFDTELVEEFFRAFVNSAKINLHIIKKAGTNSHHISEAIFKAVARSLRISLDITSDKLPSTKGLME